MYSYERVYSSGVITKCHAYYGIYHQAIAAGLIHQRLHARPQCNCGAYRH